jgi:hypothetical protein
LIAARAADATGLDPHKQTAFTSFRLMEQIYDTLLTLDADMNVVPSLATSYEWADGGTTLTMKLRENVKSTTARPSHRRMSNTRSSASWMRPPARRPARSMLALKPSKPPMPAPSSSS